MPDVKRSDVPTGEPIQRNGTGAAVIAIYNEFLGYAVDLTIDNTDPVLALTYRINSRAVATKTVPVGGVASISDAKVVLVEIVSGGTWEVSFNLVPVVKY